MPTNGILENMQKRSEGRLKIALVRGLEGSWGVLGGILEGPWRGLGGSWRPLGASWRHLGASFKLKAHFRDCWNDSWGVLEASWGRLGAIVHAGVTLASHLRHTLGRLRAVTGRFWGPSGRTTGGSSHPHTPDDPKGSADLQATASAADLLRN